MKTILLVGFGGAIGSILRYLMSKSIQSLFTIIYPLGTFTVNLIGCFAIGLIIGLAEKTNSISDDWRMFLAVGVCGGFTTFSSFANENVSLLRNGLFLQFALYSASSLFFGILLAYWGFRIAR